MKGIIIAAGYGTRFLPCSKTVPKEMFPLIDTPAIDFIVKEFIDSGIKDILIVTSRRKKSLDDYFDREMELEQIFTKENNQEKLDKIKSSEANIFLIRQKEMLGTGHALMICKEFIKDDPCIVAYPDDIVFSDVPLAKQLINIYEKTGGCVLASMTVPGDVSRYGVFDYEEKNGLMQVKELIEKPAAGKEPSNLISIGRYLYVPKMFAYLDEDFKKHNQGEFYHIHSLNKLAGEGLVYTHDFQGTRVDIGDKAGYLEAIIRYSLMRDDLKEEAKQIIKKYAESL